jgi:hypothetical protein
LQDVMETACCSYLHGQLHLMLSDTAAWTVPESLIDLQDSDTECDSLWSSAFQAPIQNVVQHAERRGSAES